jgi:hypothetical protein
VRIESSAPIVLVELEGGMGRELLHLPATPGRLDRERWGREWPTLCGLSGAGFVYAGAALDRRPCVVCVARAPASILTRSGRYVEPARRIERRKHRALSDAEIARVHELYTDLQIGIPSLAELLHQRLGYPSGRSLANVLSQEFHARGLDVRPRGTVRTNRGRRALGYGGQNPGERRLNGRTVDRLWRLYLAGHPSAAIAARFHTRFGYATGGRFRSVIEYAWKTEGRKLRSHRDAELLSRARETRARCAAMTSGADGCRPRPCSQRPLDSGLYCLHHDPDRQDVVQARAAALRARKPVLERIEWATLLPHLEPLLIPRPDRFGRRLETASGALARNTGIDPAIASRLLKGRKPTITTRYADRLLAPLGLTTHDLPTSEIRAAA